MTIPGLGEATENAWHLLRTGHSAHAADRGPSHLPKGAEHGCQGGFHLCNCCQSPASETPSVAPTVAAGRAAALLAGLSLLPPAAAELFPPFRPPQA